MLSGTNEISIIGTGYSEIQSGLFAHYIPHRVLMASGSGDPDFPLLANKPTTPGTSIWLCRNYTCRQPVFSVNELIALINSPSEGE
jgi:uncharacterized protein YyaL (SSP411 family)